MSVIGNVGLSVRTDVILRLCVVVSLVRERGHLGVGVSYVRALSGFVHFRYVVTVDSSQLWLFFHVVLCEDSGSNPV